jgi:hypothetical protein
MAYDSFTFMHEGRDFVATLHHDSYHGAPWDECDGHGPVTGWTRRDKRPGEMVLSEDRGSRRYYDFAEATEIAKRDGWGLCDVKRAALAARLGREPTRNEVVRAAVLADFEHLRGWCNDDWHWCGVVVRLADGDPNATESLWGIESNAGDYLQEAACELADALLAEDKRTDAAIAAAFATVAAAAAGIEPRA